MLYFILFFAFGLAMLLYFRIANHYNIVDKPNERSSHKDNTIRGGGVIFLVAALIAALVHPVYWMPVTGMFLIGIISFIDDRVTLSSRVRIIFHLLSVSILFYYLKIFETLPVYGVLLLYILVIGVINAYNFMDGINGITGLYSLVVLSGLQFVNLYQTRFVDVDMIWFPMIAVSVFLFFNLRIRAKCFAGDVGSVTIALWIVFLLLILMLGTHDLKFILFLSVYGVDAILTIIHRLMLKQNIFKPHRLHFYQLLANEKKIPHVFVTIMYGTLQLVINVFIISTNYNFLIASLIVCVPLVLVYIVFKPVLMKNRTLPS